jgi:hypothetical protein
VGVRAITYVWRPPPGIVTGVFGEPVTAFVEGSVVWYPNTAGMLVSGAIPHVVAVPRLRLMIVANAVAGEST